MDIGSIGDIIAKPITALLDGFVKVEDNVGTKGLLAIIFAVAGGTAIIYSIEVPGWGITTIQMIVTLYFGGSLAAMNPNGKNGKN